CRCNARMGAIAVSTAQGPTGDHQGLVVAGALGSHEAARECRGLKPVACWAHVRRFRDVVVDFSEGQFILAWIEDLCAIDVRALVTSFTGSADSAPYRGLTASPR